MRNDVIEAIKYWAGRPTWFSPHPSDTKELRSAVSNLKRIQPRPTKEEIYNAIIYYVEDMPIMLGTPTDINKAAREFAEKISGKI